MTNGAGPVLSEQIAQRGREVVVERLRSAFAHQAAAHDHADADPERLERMVQEAAARAGETLWRRSLAQAVMEELGIELDAALAHPVLTDAQVLIDAPAEQVPTTDVALAENPPADDADTDVALAENPPADDADTDAGPPADDAGPPADDADAALAEGPPPAGGEPHHLDLGIDPEHAQPTPPEVDEPHPEPVPMVADAQALRLSAVHLSGIETLYQGDDDLELRLSEAGLDVLKRSNGAAIGRLEWSEIETVALPAPKRGLRSRRRSRELHVSTGRGQAQFELPGLTDEELHDYLEPTLARLRQTAAGSAAADRDGQAADSSAAGEY